MCTHHEDFNPYSKDLESVKKQLDRRTFLTKTSLGLGALALGSLMGTGKLFGRRGAASVEEEALASTFPNFLPKAKRIVYLFQSGGPSQLDMFDYKPMLDQYHGQDLPASVRKGQRLTGMSADQASLPITP